MASEDLGKDMASVDALLKKYQHHEADMTAHEVQEAKTDREREGGKIIHIHQLFIIPTTRRRESKISMLKRRNL